VRVLLSTIGSRGDVQPVVALAVELRDRGQQVRLCVPPDFQDWLTGLGFEVVPIGPVLRPTASASGPRVAQATPQQRQAMIEGTVATQFAAVPAAAEGCDVLVAGGARQIAARSVAEQLGIAYVYTSCCPVTLPSPHHAPPPMGPPTAPADNRTQWAEDARRWNDNFGPALNSHRAAAGLAPVTDVRGHIFTDRPWLAADPTLGPWPDPADPTVVRTGAWIAPDDRRLPSELLDFLAAGEAPVYFGFGSMRAPADLARTMITAARALGRRAIVSRGWADLSLLDDEPDCLSVGEVNQQELFVRVAAVVHHGGAGTTTTAALAHAPQVVVPQIYDQRYWGRRIDQLGIGAAHPPVAPTVDSLVTALSSAVRPEVKVRAEETTVRTDGTAIAAQHLLDLIAGS
jgi:vancomycin aglycone glucosyltransferase